MGHKSKHVAKGGIRIMRHIFILIPSLHPTGPIKGAVALANSLSGYRDTTLVSLKSGPGSNATIDPAIKVISLASIKSPLKKIKEYRRLLQDAGGRKKVASISFCLSADVVNLICKRDAITISSVRGNLPRNYRFEYGWKGGWIATVHLRLLRWFDDVVAMTESMAVQISRFSGQQPRIVGNFVDEEKLRKYLNTPRRKQGPFRFVFVGSLTERKQVQLIIEAAVELKGLGDHFRIDLVGDGKIRDNLIKCSKERQVDDVVKFHGFVSEPFNLISKADCMVLPSMSEGISRAVLESLFFGVPCILRDTDGHKEVIRCGSNGFLFSEDKELAKLMIHAAKWARQHIRGGAMLIPGAYRQSTAAQQYLAIIDPEAPEHRG